MDLNSGDSYFIVIDGTFVAVGGDAQEHFENDTLEKDSRTKSSTVISTRIRGNWYLCRRITPR